MQFFTAALLTNITLIHDNVRGVTDACRLAEPKTQNERYLV